VKNRLSCWIRRASGLLSASLFFSPDVLVLGWSWIGVPPGFEHYVAADVQFQAAAPFTWFGWVGVEIFFVISGFVMANSAIKSSATEFVSGRALRLYPAVWVYSILTFIVLLLFASGSASEFIVP